VLVHQLADDFFQYPYLPRLKNAAVLLDAIEDGVATITWRDDTFAYADAYDEASGRYQGLKAGQSMKAAHDLKSVVVKADAASLQIEKETQKKTGEVQERPQTLGTVPSGSPQEGSGAAPAEAKPLKRFYGSVSVDALKASRDVGKIAEEVLIHLVNLDGAKAEVTLEVQVDIPGGVPDSVQRIVRENCAALKFKECGFEEE